MTGRTFKAAAICLLAMALGALGCGESGGGTEPAPDPVLFISIDSLHPGYLDLNADGEAGGTDGDWLMPKVHRFLGEAVHFAESRCYLPSATDMNHLNVLAGTSSAQTGIVGVTTQLVNWNADGTPFLDNIDLSMSLDGQGRPTDTLFNAWKRRWPASKTVFISGKGWVADMYKTDGADIEIFVTGTENPAYLPAPYDWSFYDPETDVDAEEDPESWAQTTFCNLVFDSNPELFPPDAWVVDATLDVLREETPAFGLILLAQMDDAQHALGTAWDPDEFEACSNLESCDRRSKRNPRVFREPVLDAVRDVDAQFGRLVDGIRRLDAYKDVTIILYSDHSHITHLIKRVPNMLDWVRSTTDVADILFQEEIISRAERDGTGFYCLSGSSLGACYFKGDSVYERQERARAAKDVLGDHKVRNPETGEWECPWIVLDHADMRDGLRDEDENRWLVDPGELWHAYFGDNNNADTLVWPDIILLARNGWQIPVYDGVLGNLGVDIPFPLPPLTVFIGGHGGLDTEPIVMAMGGPGIATGKVINDAGYESNYRIADLAVTVANRFGLELTTETVGIDRSVDLE